ncbi:uncharacterized protein Art8 [Halyomorpha halys]|uniref:uncharacterized protein Art8 n=1 Tax=Halyomorpha halys TaxID=286706 RepID=UPI0006D5121B|nr:protein arginine N-methyltransferase 1 [Halyomorpha halys]XP_014284744.1 protein arginine N-methyltransferase 1 [Halyomorpha halys]
MSSKYFTSYDDLNVHKLMLTDNVRMKSYKDAILSNKDLFMDSIVLDVGAGCGILSIFAAQAGAKTVYSVEAAPSLTPLIKQVVEENKFSHVIKVIEGEMERVIIPEKVDIIISEWMGFYLLHEGMLDSVLFAKKYLKPNGVMFPEECTLYISLCELPQYFDEWYNLHGVKMGTFGKSIRELAQGKPEIGYICKDSLLSNPLEIFRFKPLKSDQSEFSKITAKHVVAAKRAGKFQGVCIWFDVKFPVPTGSVVLSTSPYGPETHWKQTVIVLPDEIILEDHEPVAFEITFLKMQLRNYQITFQLHESDDVEHPTPCKCYLARCRVIKAFLDECIDPA